jgi:hypothetical protein
MVPRVATTDLTTADSLMTVEQVALDDRDVDADETIARDSSNHDLRVVSRH